MVGGSSSIFGMFLGRFAFSRAEESTRSASHPHWRKEEHEARVWDLETLEPLHTLKQPAGQDVCELASDGGDVWAAGGKVVVVWGRRV